MTSASPVVFDTDVVVSLISIKRADLMSGWPCYAMLVTDVNALEFAKEQTKPEFERLVADKVLEVYEIRDPLALEHFALMRKRADLGESGVVAAVIVLKGSGLSNDKDAIKVARKHTPAVHLGDLRDLLVRAYQAGRLDGKAIQEIQTRCLAAKVFVPFVSGFAGQSTIDAENWLLPELPPTLVKTA